MSDRSNVSLRGIEVAYGPIRVLDRLDLEVEQSEFLVLLGPSGCGKSTLLYAIAGLTEVDDGEIWIGDRNVTWLEPKDRGIAMVFQSYALYPRMNVRGNMSFGLKVARMPRALWLRGRGATLDLPTAGGPAQCNWPSWSTGATGSCP